MKWEELLRQVADEPAFRTGFLAGSGESLSVLRLQLSRWVKTGKLIQLTRGLYTLAKPYGKQSPHPFVLANAMKKASYVSLQSALGVIDGIAAGWWHSKIHWNGLKRIHDAYTKRLYEMGGAWGGVLMRYGQSKRGVGERNGYKTRQAELHFHFDGRPAA